MDGILRETAWPLLGTGIRWDDWEPDNPKLLSLIRVWDHSPWTIIQWKGILTVCVLAGAWRLFSGTKHCKGAVLLACIAVFTPLIAFLVYGSSEAIVHYWYLVFLLPFVWAMIATGLVQISDWLPKVRGVSLLYVLILPAFLLNLAWVTKDYRRLLVSTPIESTRESVELTRSDRLNPDSEVMTIGFVKNLRLYDPAHHRVKSFGDFAKVIAEAEKSGKDLYINFGMIEAARKGEPEIMKYVEDPKVFQPIDTLYGLEYTTTRIVKKYIRGSIDPQDLQ